MQKIDKEQSQHLTLFALAILLTLIGVVFIWGANTFNEKTLTGGVDFLAYYSGGYIVRFIDSSRLYDLNLQKGIQALIIDPDLVSRFYPYNHPPVYVPLLGWAITSDYIQSYIRWLSILFLFHIASTMIAIKIIKLFNWTHQNALYVGVAILLFIPIHLAYERAQDSTLLLLGALLWTYGLLSKNDSFSGFGLALSMIRPQIGLALLIPTILKRKRIVWRFIFFGWLIFVVNYPFIKWRGLVDFIYVLALSGNGYGFDVDRMSTLMGWILRTFPTIPPQTFHLIGYSAYLGMIFFVTWLWRQSEQADIKLISLAVLVSMLFSPHLHSHDFSLLIIPIIGTMVTLSRETSFQQKNISLIPFGISALLFFGEYIPSHTIVYLIFLFLAVSLYINHPRIAKIFRLNNRKERDLPTS